MAQLLGLPHRRVALRHGGGGIAAGIVQAAQAPCQDVLPVLEHPLFSGDDGGAVRHVVPAKAGDGEGDKLHRAHTLRLDAVLRKLRTQHAGCSTQRAGRVKGLCHREILILREVEAAVKRLCGNRRQILRQHVEVTLHGLLCHYGERCVGSVPVCIILLQEVIRKQRLCL